MSLNTTAATWVSGSVVTAAQMNTEIRDAVNGLQAAWTAYTPTTTGDYYVIVDSFYAAETGAFTLKVQ